MMFDRFLVDEEKAEILALTDLATNLGDGMQMLSPANLARPIKSFGEFPDELCQVPDFAERFISWQVARMEDAKGKADWSHPDALADVKRYLNRKVWQVKVTHGAVINPVARMLAATAHLHRQYRADVHEALNHAAKHNQDVKALPQELRDQLDEVVRERLADTLKVLAGAALSSLPQLQQVLMMEQLPSHDGLVKQGSTGEEAMVVLTGGDDAE